MGYIVLIIVAIVVIIVMAKKKKAPLEIKDEDLVSKEINENENNNPEA